MPGLKLTLLFQFLFVFAVFNKSEAQAKVTAETVIKYINETVTICDTITGTKYVSSSLNKPTLLNMGGVFPNQKFTIVIDEESRKNFSFKPEENYNGRFVCVTGKVELFKGLPQMHVSNPSEIKEKETESVVKERSENKTSNTIVKITVAKSLREGPGESFETIEMLKPGSSVTVISTKKGWSLVAYKRFSRDQKREITLKGFIKD